jgi:hypothetical protein
MSYTRNQNITNTPNTGAPFNQQTSFQSDLFDSQPAHGGGEMGVGSFKVRSIDDVLVEYEPANTALNTMIMLLGENETVDNVVHEWGEDDAYLPIDATGWDTPANLATVINNVAGGTSYVPAATANFQVSNADAEKFRKKFKIRYTSTGGGFTYASVTDIIDGSAGTNKYLVLTSLNGTDVLPVASGAEADIQIVDVAYGSDKNYEPEPIGTNPSMVYNYAQKYVTFGSWTERSENEANTFDQAMRAQNQAFRDMNFKLEGSTLYGKRAKRLDNGDWTYFTEGLYETTKAQNYHTAAMTDSTGRFDATKFKDSLYNFVQFNFGAESGGPAIRQAFIDGRMSNYLDRAFEDKQRFYSNEFVGGVKVSRFELSDGILDFVRLPHFELRHPIPNGSLRQSGTPRATMLMVPIRETVSRFTMNGEGLRADVYRQKGGDEELIYRVRGTMGVKHKLRQYSGILEEVAA